MADGTFDAGVQNHFTGEQIKGCDEAKITTYLRKPRTSNNRAKGLFDKQDFIYQPADDEYECPAGERLIKRTRSEKDGMKFYRYWSPVCGQCALKEKCTTGKERRVTRWQHEELIEALQARLDKTLR